MNLSLIEATKLEFVKETGFRTTNLVWHERAKELYNVRIILKKYETLEKKLKDELIAMSSDRTTYNEEYVWERKERAGTVDYAKIIKDYSIEKEKYRKESIVSWKLSRL